MKVKSVYSCGEAAGIKCCFCGCHFDRNGELPCGARYRWVSMTPAEDEIEVENPCSRFNIHTQYTTTVHFITEQPAKHKCNCSRQTVVTKGCQCGGI